MGKRRFVKILLACLPLLLVGIQWMTDEVVKDHLLMEVPKVCLLPWLDSKFAYLYLHLFTFLPVFTLSFDNNVGYYRKWKYLFPAVAIAGVIFILWDVFFTAKGVWGFNSKFLLGFHFLGLPVEEWLFFFTVPFASIFIYECLNTYIRRDWLAPLDKVITSTLIVVFFVFGFIYWSHMYTATTFLLTGFFLLYHFLFIENTYRSRFYLAYFVSCIPFLVVNGVLTGGYTTEPVVLYNPEEYFGLRLTSVPIDDSVYSFLLLLLVVTLFEFFRKN